MTHIEFYWVVDAKLPIFRQSNGAISLLNDDMDSMCRWKNIVDLEQLASQADESSLSGSTPFS